jgi:hypothetical protein
MDAGLGGLPARAGPVQAAPERELRESELEGPVDFAYLHALHSGAVGVGAHQVPTPQALACVLSLTAETVPLVSPDNAHKP